MTDSKLTAARRFFGLKVRLFIASRGLSFKRVAAGCGCSTSAVKGWIKGQHVPDSDRMKRLARSLQTCCDAVRPTEYITTPFFLKTDKDGRLQWLELRDGIGFHEKTEMVAITGSGPNLLDFPDEIGIMPIMPELPQGNLTLFSDPTDEPRPKSIEEIIAETLVPAETEEKNLSDFREVCIDEEEQAELPISSKQSEERELSEERNHALEVMPNDSDGTSRPEQNEVSLHVVSDESVSVMLNVVPLVEAAIGRLHPEEREAVLTSIALRTDPERGDSEDKENLTDGLAWLFAMLVRLGDCRFSVDATSEALSEDAKRLIESLTTDRKWIAEFARSVEALGSASSAMAAKLALKGSETPDEIAAAFAALIAETPPDRIAGCFEDKQTPLSEEIPVSDNPPMSEEADKPQSPEAKGPEEGTVESALLEGLDAAYEHIPEEDLNRISEALAGVQTDDAKRERLGVSTAWFLTMLGRGAFKNIETQLSRLAEDITEPVLNQEAAFATQWLQPSERRGWMTEYWNIVARCLGPDGSSAAVPAWFSESSNKAGELTRRLSNVPPEELLKFLDDYPVRR